MLIGNIHFDGDGVVDGVLDDAGWGVLHCSVLIDSSSKKLSSTKSEESHNCCGKIVSTSSSLEPKLRLRTLMLKCVGSFVEGSGDGGLEDGIDFRKDILRRTSMVEEILFV